MSESYENPVAGFNGIPESKEGKPNNKINLVYLDSIDSTNMEARRILEASSSGPFIVVAREQTAGRGRQGKSFFSPKNSGIYMTIALPTGEIPSGVVTLTCRVGIAVSKAIDAEFGCRTGIKWVNDIFLSGRKICGILCEAISGEGGAHSHILIGIGINISTVEFPDDIKNSAGSVLSVMSSSENTAGSVLPIAGTSKNTPGSVLSSANSSECSFNEKMTMSGNAQYKAPLESVTGEFIRRFAMQIYDSVIRHLAPSYDPIADYKERSVVLGKDVTFYENGVAYSAHAVDIDEMGGLVVRLPDTGWIRTLSSGEISLRVYE